MSSNNAVGTYELGAQPVRRDQCDGGPMRWGGGGGGQWNGRCVCANWGTNGIGDQSDGGPLGLAEIGWMNEKGDQNVVGDL